MCEQHLRAAQRKHHLVYRTKCTITGKYYIGMHSTDIFEDGYLGSGWRLQRSIKKYGKEAFIREIIADCETRRAASALEKELITSDLLKDPMCLNLRNGGTGQACGYRHPEDTKKKMSDFQKVNWVTKRQKLKEHIWQELTNFKLSRDEILDILLTHRGHLNKNASRYLPPKAPKMLGDHKLGKRAVLNQAKWKYIWEIVQNPEFGNDPVELINAYINNLTIRPTCKICSGRVSFFRFNRPYAVYCGNRCQLLDPSVPNPVLSRYE